jgi:hypothetical protein
MVQKLGGKATAKPATAPVVDEGKKETKVPVSIDLSNLRDTYSNLEAACKEKSATGVKADDMIAVVTKVFEETGKDELLLAPVANIVKAQFGKKLYNQLRSSILAKTSGYDLDTRESGQVFIVKGKKEKPADE